MGYGIGGSWGVVGFIIFKIVSRDGVVTLRIRGR